MVEDHRPTQRSRRAAVAFIAALILLLAAITVGAIFRNDSIQNTCEAVNGNRTILRGILLRSEQLTLRHYEPGSGFSRGQIVGYYERSIDDLAPASC